MFLLWFGFFGKELQKHFIGVYRCFTMLCQCLLYSKVNQLYDHIHAFFFRFPSHLGSREWSSLCYAVGFLIFIYILAYVCQFQSPSSSQAAFPSLTSLYLLLTSVSLLLLCKRIHLTLFQIPPVCVNMHLFFYF